MKHEKNEAEFTLNNTKKKMKEMEREGVALVDKLKMDFEGQKDILNSKIVSLEKTLSDMRRYYKV